MRSVLRVGVFLLLLSAGLTAVAQTRWKLGIVPQLPAQEIQRQWRPVADWLETACAVRIEIDIAASIPQFEQGFARGDFELAYMNPYHAVMARQAQGYIPLVRDSQRMLSGVLVVPRDSPIRDVRDLAGKTVAFPAPNAFGASLFMRGLLEKEFGVVVAPAYVRTHSNSYRHVLTGEAAAAGGVDATLQREPEHVRSALRILFRTPEVPPHPLSAHPRIPADQRLCIARTLVNARTDPVRSPVLAGIQIPAPVEADFDRDYQPLVRLQLDRFVVE